MTSIQLPEPANQQFTNEDRFTPKYHRLKRILREKIVELRADEMLPSESELCQAYNVSRTTVRKALSELIQERLVYTVQGKGTFVAPKKLRSTWVQETGGLYADMTERGFKVQMHVLDVSVISAEENIRKELLLTEGEKVIKLIRLRFIDDKPFDIVTNFMPARLFPGLEKEDFSSTSLYTILRNKYDVQFDRGVRMVEAGACTAEEARLLQIKPNSPLLIMYSTMYNDKGEAFEHGIVHQRSDVAQVVINVIPS
jgi:GntR family transcriptional regulator